MMFQAPSEDEDDISNMELILELRVHYKEETDEAVDLVSQFDIMSHLAGPEVSYNPIPMSRYLYNIPFIRKPIVNCCEKEN